MTQDSKTIIKISGLAIMFVLIAGYSLYVSRGVILGVKIKNIKIGESQIASGETFTESTQKVTGNAKNAIHLTLNGREIFINQAGDFEETVALLPGYNIMNIRAEDKFGYVDEENYKLILLKR